MFKDLHLPNVVIIDFWKYKIKENLHVNYFLKHHIIKYYPVCAFIIFKLWPFQLFKRNFI